MAVFTTAQLLSTLALAAFLVPAAARADQSAVDSRSAVVSTSGLDLATPQDQAVLRHRVAVAAHQVCEQVTQGDGMGSPGYTECFNRAKADARAQVEAQIAMANSRAMLASITAK